MGITQDYEILTSSELKLNQKDMLIFLTDGILETHSPDGTEFGIKRTLAAIKGHIHSKPQEIIEHIYNEVCSFTENKTQADDY